MPRLIWCMLTVGAFGTGLAIASLYYSSAPQVPAEPLATVADWQHQVAVLQGQICTQEAELTILRQQVQMLVGDPTSRGASSTSSAQTKTAKAPEVTRISAGQDARGDCGIHSYGGGTIRTE
jgi:hypothetical protein